MKEAGCKVHSKQMKTTESKHEREKEKTKILYLSKSWMMMMISLLIFKLTKIVGLLTLEAIPLVDSTKRKISSKSSAVHDPSMYLESIQSIPVDYY
jgi:hypothetical protein